jgi:hypothetical protein
MGRRARCGKAKRRREPPVPSPISEAGLPVVPKGSDDVFERLDETLACFADSAGANDISSALM